LILIAAILIVVIVILIAAKPKSTPDAINMTGSTPASTTASAGTTSAGTDTSTFDATTATKVPAGEQPIAFVEDYYKAVVKGDYQTAYQHLPEAKKEAQSLADFESQLKGYGITSYTMGTSNTSGSTMTIEAGEVAGAYGTFTTIWTFVKQGDSWLLQSKAVAGMQ
jgi:hypothetical protein